MLATLFVHLPLAIASVLQPTVPPECLLDVMTPLAIEDRALVEFNSRLAAYLTTQRRLARALSMFDDEDPFFAEELRRSLMSARPGARPGDFFTPGISEIIRHRIDVALADAGGSGIPFSRGVPLESRARVNEPLRIVPDPFAWAPVILALPPLPAEVGYVVWGGDLVLVDSAANLVIDVLADAVPAWPAFDVIYR